MEILRILDPSGVIVREDLFQDLKLKPEFHKKLYQHMILARLIDREGRLLGTTGKGDPETGQIDPNYKLTLWIGPYGQEAAEIASALAFPTGSWFRVYGRSWGVLLARGITTKNTFDLHFGNITGDLIEEVVFKHKTFLPDVTVGIHLSQAVGIKWAEELRGEDGGALVAAYFGDGATAEGYFHEALNWAAIYRIPVIFFCENNQYAISTPTMLNTPTATFAERARGYDMAFEYVDGNDPYAVIYATRRAIRRARIQKRPTLVELVTYRLGPHTTAAKAIIKISEEEKQEGIRNDPLRRYQLFILSERARTIGINWDQEISWGAALYEELKSASDAERNFFFRDTNIELRREDAGLLARLDDEVKEAAARARETFVSLFAQGKDLVAKSVEWHQTPRVKIYSAEEISKLEGNAEWIPDAPDVGLRDVLDLALFDAMRLDPDIIVLGEDISRAGGVNREGALREDLAAREPFIARMLPDWENHILSQYLPLAHLFPERIRMANSRIVDTPLDERGTIGTGLGLALNFERKIRPAMGMQFSGFIRIGLDQAEEFPRMIHRSAGKLDVPGLITMPFGGGERIEFHKENEMPLFLNSPGFIIICPSNPQDAYDMRRAALLSNRIVIEFTHLDLYRLPQIKTLLRRHPAIPIEDFGVRVAREGNNVTVVAYGRMVLVCLEVAEKLATQNISVEVLDLRVISPLKEDVIIESVKKTGRIVTVDEGPKQWNVGAEIISVVAENESSEFLRARSRRVSSPRTYPPPSKYWIYYIPQPEEIEAAILETVNYPE